MDETANRADDFGRAFEGAFGRLQVAVLEACATEREWPAKVAAAIYAALGFAAAEPDAARILTIDALVERAGGGERYVRLVLHFADLLAAEAPRDRRLPKTTEQALAGGIAVIVADEVRAGRAETLSQRGPELVQITLLPFLGRAEAVRWSRATAP